LASRHAPAIAVLVALGVACGGDKPNPVPTGPTVPVIPTVKINGGQWGLRAARVETHPEFAPAYAAALVGGRRGNRTDPDHADAAIASLNDPDDRALMGEWLRRFLTA